MKSILFVLVLAVAALGQDLPPPGNPDHVTPAPGQVCRHAGPGVPAGQACACEPKCMDGQTDGMPDGTTWRVEDVLRCRVACHPKSCACVSNCEP